MARTELGALRGRREGDVVAFRGVPYAEPPVGELRWRPPQPVQPWTGERDATTDGPIAPQDISPERLAKRGATMSEDCLSVNVWTPSADDERRPVLVFLHGGGAVAGSGSAPLLDGGRLAPRGDVVVVTVNFRLGALGSLYAPGLVGTNLAFRDQLLALGWVRAHIGGFGGDPADVTVVGQSSGAVAVACMLASDAAAGLFDRAVLQSGGLERVRSTAAAADVARRFLAELGDVDDLRSVAVADLLAAQATIPTGFVPPVGPWHHCVDGDVIPEHPLVAAGRRPLHPVPVLIGTTRDEWRAFDTVLADDEVTDDVVLDRARALGAGEHALDVYAGAAEGGDPMQRRRTLASALVTDFHFTAPSHQFARAHAARGHRTFRYQLRWPSPRPGLGACHDTDLPLLFGTMDRAPALAGTPEAAAAMSAIVQDAWLAFVRTGDPSTEATGRWPTYETGTTMVLGPACAPVEDLDAERLAVWEGRYPAAG